MEEKRKKVTDGVAHRQDLSYDFLHFLGAF